MTLLSCPCCGTEVGEALAHCPECHAILVRALPPSEQEARAADCLCKARNCQRQGDIAQALCYAREALTLGADASCTHALLGRLYELQANTTAAQYHFQSALHVAEQQDDLAEPLASPQLMHESSAHQTPPSFMLLVLMGCVLFSGLAALFAFHSPAGRLITQSQLLPIQVDRPALPTAPPWTWQVPHAMSDTPPSAIALPAPAPTDTPVVPVSEAHPVIATPSVSSTSATPSTSPAPEAVLGPEAHIHHLVAEARPTIAEADQAYFDGDYERAVSIYEDVLAQHPTPNPRLYQDLAWCYQQLGNSRQAARNLQLAIQGYQALLANDAANSTAQQAKTACENALQTLLATREHAAP